MPRGRQTDAQGGSLGVPADSPALGVTPGKVSVVVPCYRYGHLLRECVESVLEQDGVEVAVLIIDDASPDDTPAVSASLMRQDSRVQYRRHTVNQGHIATFNEGVEWASGDYLLLLSADDLLAEGAMKRVTRALDANPQASFGYGRALVWRQGLPKPSSSTSDGTCTVRVVPGRSWIEQVCRLGDNLVRSPEVITRTTFQKKVGGYRARFPHTSDMEMWLRLAAHGDVLVVDADSAFYRIHDDNMHILYQQSVVGLEQRRSAILSVLDEYPDRIDGIARLRRLARYGVVQAEIRKTIQSLDRGEGRTEAIVYLRRAIRFDPVHAVGCRAFFTCAIRLLIGPRVYRQGREFVLRLIRPLSDSSMR